MATGSAFPDVAAAVEAELEEYKKAESHIKGLKTDLPGDDAIDLLSDNTAKLTSAITSLPELIKKKAEIDKHMSIAMGEWKWLIPTMVNLSPKPSPSLTLSLG